MKLFQRMLVASAAAGLLAPVAAQAADINLDGVSNYSSSSQSSNVNFSDVQPSDWAFKALKETAASRGCNVLIPSTAISRYEAAALLNSCLADVAEVNSQERSLLNEFASELAVLKGRVDGIEAQVSQFEAGGFSDTTKMGGKAIFVVGSVEHDKDTATDSSGYMPEGLMFEYKYQLDLNTSFTGEDNLYVRIVAGNSNALASGETNSAASPFSNKSMGTYLSASNQNGNVLDVDKLWYQFPVGDSITGYVGPLIENYYMHGAVPSLYKPVLKQFALGGNGAAYGASTSAGAGFVWRADNGFAISSNIVSDTDGATSGFLTDQSKHSWATQFSWTKPRYHVSYILNLKYNDWEDSYYTTVSGKARTAGSTNSGIRAYWRPEEVGTAVPEVSVGYDFSDIDGAAATVDSTTAWFAGFTWKDVVRDDSAIGIAIGQPQTREDESVDPFTWEAYYSFKATDSITVRPAIFGGTDRNGTAGDDVTGAVLETTFKF